MGIGLNILKNIRYINGKILLRPNQKKKKNDHTEMGAFFYRLNTFICYMTTWVSFYTHIWNMSIQYIYNGDME